MDFRLGPVLERTDRAGPAWQPSTRNRKGLAASAGKKQVFEHDSGRQSINPLKARLTALISWSGGAGVLEAPL